MDIEYSITDENELDIVAPLWEQLNEHHGSISRHFSFDYPDRKWINRKNELLDDAVDGQLRIDLARDNDSGRLMRYCITSVKRDGLGEIDSIFVESGYRRCGIGGKLIKNALHWLAGIPVNKIIVQVIVDNEQAYPFYSRYGFLPRSTIFMRVPENDTSGS